MTKFDYDLFVIGAGSGGVRAARISAGYGAKVAVAEEYRVGGTCVIRGCVPKKLLVYASRFADDFEDARGFGWTVGEPKFDWPALVAAKDKELARLEAAYRTALGNAGVEIIAERATVVGPNAVQLKSGRTITARKILIATGGTPWLAESRPGLEHVITSNEAFDLPRLPASIVVAGGGYIAAEFAGIFSRFGVETTLIYRGDKILRGFDEDVRDRLTEAYTKQGIRIVTGQIFTHFEKTAAGLVGHLSGGGKLEAEQIMFAIGRTPNTRGLGLEKAGVEVGWNGHVVVNEYSKSSVDSIFAVGDVTDRVQLTPVAIREGHAFADTEFGGKPRMIEHTMIPTAVFSTPEIATIGLPEHLARERCTKLDIYKASFRPIKATLSGRDERMFMKLLVDGESGKVIGCHVMGEDAAEIVQMAAIAIRLGATKADFDNTMALHPTSAEELVTMREKWIAPTEAAC
ncbi:glutathione-disulfide reductase [Hyphomicrobium sp. xq]|uniref:Glutathione reductase n=1 Tax=Hyphomicrobium album TaxID=2665159 RepID=A0A6I3KFL1_9HYPH|nr:glutathione-disulfide reductase [Hyphomicrobium album]MTD92790.1 glutathione-disulfide reductase [Hyphomicrobium album]